MQISSSYNSYDYYSSKPSFDKTNQSDSTQKDEKNLSENKDDKEKNGEQTQMVNGVELSQKEVAQVRELQSIDRNVKAHEAAHQAAGGGLAGAASFTYTRGPDNQMCYSGRSSYQHAKRKHTRRNYSQCKTNRSSSYGSC